MEESPELREQFHRLNNQLGIILAHAELLEAKSFDDVDKVIAHIERFRELPKSEQDSLVRACDAYKLPGTPVEAPPQLLRSNRAEVAPNRRPALTVRPRSQGLLALASKREGKYR